MKICTQNFTKSLEAKDLNFSVRENNGTDIVDFPWQGKNIRCLFKGDEGEYLSIYYCLESVPEDKISDALLVCNEMNAKFKWVKFYLDNDNDLILEDDAILSPATASDEAFELLLRMIDILKDSKPAFMKAIYA